MARQRLVRIRIVNFIRSHWLAKGGKDDGNICSYGSDRGIFMVGNKS
jgi:hypothetical protein